MSVYPNLPEEGCQQSFLLNSIDFKSNTINWFFTLLTMETGLLMADL